MKASPPISIDHSSKFTIEQVISVAKGNCRLKLASNTEKLLAKRRLEILSAISESPHPAYGFNRGFGHNVDVAVPSDQLAQLQLNLIRSHSSGVGPYASREVVRATMLLRAQSLARGYSGVRPEVVLKIIEFLNRDVVPAVPLYGSVGASGDLAPLSHIALALIGEGQVYDPRNPKKILATQKVLKNLKIAPLVLEMKEGLALNNGVQFSTAMGIIALDTLRQLLKTAVIATALSNQVLLGSDSPYREDLLKLRPHPGMLKVGSWLRKLIKGSPLREAHREFKVDGEVQDPYSLRCAPQVLGSCYDLIEDAANTFELEANSVTDNPLILPVKGQFTAIVSGGHFHGMPVAVKLYNLVQAMGIMAALTNVRCARYVDEARNRGLGADLIWPKLTEAARAASSGMMIPEYVSAALTNTIWGASMPSHLFSLSTDAGQEDHVSMSATLAVRVLETVPRLAELLAIELAFAAQAAAIRSELDSIPSKSHAGAKSKKIAELKERLAKEAVRDLNDKSIEAEVQIAFRYKISRSQRKLNPRCEKILAAIYKKFPIVTADRALSENLGRLSASVLCGEIADLAGLT